MGDESISGTFDLRALGDRLRSERLARALTLEELARCTGVSRSMISALENGGKAPTIVILDRIARGLGMRLVDLIAEAEPHRVIVIRDDEQSEVVDPSGWIRRNLMPSVPGVSFEWMRTTIPPGVDAGTFPAHRPGSREHIVVTHGCLNLTIDGVRYDLNAGDAISYDGECEHQFENRGLVDCIYFLALVESRT